MPQRARKSIFSGPEESSAWRDHRIPRPHVDFAGWCPRQKLAATFLITKERVSETRCTHTWSLGSPAVSCLSVCFASVFLTRTMSGGRTWWRAYSASRPREHHSFSTPNKHTHTINSFCPNLDHSQSAPMPLFLITQWGEGAGAIYILQMRKVKLTKQEAICPTSQR